MFDGLRGVRTALKHGRRTAAMQLLVALRQCDDALRLAETYDERLAVVEQARPLPHALLVTCG